MKKHDDLRKAVRENSLALVVDVKEQTFLPYGVRTTFYICPSENGLYTADALNSWFKEFASDIAKNPELANPNWTVMFKEEDYGFLGIELKWGQLQFKDVVGRREVREVTTYNISDVDFARDYFGGKSSVVNERPDSNDVTLSTNIEAFPDRIIAGGRHYSSIRFNDYPQSGRVKVKKKGLIGRLIPNFRKD